MTKKEKELRSRINALEEERRIDQLEIANLRDQTVLLMAQLKLKNHSDQGPTNEHPFPEFKEGPIYLDKVEAAL